MLLWNRGENHVELNLIANVNIVEQECLAFISVSGTTTMLVKSSSLQKFSKKSICKPGVRYHVTTNKTRSISPGS